MISPPGPVYPRFDQPIAIEWDTPIAAFSYRVSPFVPSSSKLDVAGSRTVLLTLEDYVPGQRYQIDVLEAVSTNGISLQQPGSLYVVMPKSPTPHLDSPTLLPFGELLVVRWDEPIEDFEYEIDPAVPSNATVDPADRHQAIIDLQSFVQGQEYRVTISDAVAKNGLHLQKPHTFIVNTPVALNVVKTTPGEGAFGVKPNQNVCVTLDEAIVDRTAAERSVEISPFVDGRFEWQSESSFCYVPTAGFSFGTDIKVRISSGPENVRGSSGSYLEDDVVFQFTIRPNKLIDVDLTRQTVRLFEGEKLVLTTLTSTGVKGAETPTGTYMVQYKMKATRMRGITPSGSRYDLPNVPWVLAFWGDYTIHGAYWRNGYGFPQSNGCVSLPVPVAERIFYWAPEGTPIVIHY
jgi:hypothetical protein